MMNKTGIEWTDFSWNPVTGCEHECDYCYAKAINHRFKKSWNPMFHDNRIEQPLHKKEGSKIFVCSMADLFGDWVPRKWILDILNIVKKCPQHTFQFLTKNPKRYLEFDFPSNVWLGATATNQEMYDNAITIFNKLNASVKYLSCEPLLDKIEMHSEVDWLIIGACSYPKKSQPSEDWVLDMIDYAKSHNINIFLKPNLEVVNHELFKEFPKHDNKCSSVQLALI